jgi:hypothetical protein
VSFYILPVRVYLQKGNAPCDRFYSSANVTVNSKSDDLRL